MKILHQKSYPPKKIAFSSFKSTFLEVHVREDLQGNSSHQDDHLDIDIRRDQTEYLIDCQCQKQHERKQLEVIELLPFLDFLDLFLRLFFLFVDQFDDIG